jgi:hypothetical protein
MLTVKCDSPACRGPAVAAGCALSLPALHRLPRQASPRRDGRSGSHERTKPRPRERDLVVLFPVTYGSDHEINKPDSKGKGPCRIRRRCIGNSRSGRDPFPLRYRGHLRRNPAYRKAVESRLSSSSSVVDERKWVKWVKWVIHYVPRVRARVVARSGGRTRARQRYGRKST